jgi:hypothetical protein
MILVLVLVVRNGGTENNSATSSSGRLKFFYEKIKFRLKIPTLLCYSLIPFLPLPVGIRHRLVEHSRVSKKTESVYDG